LAIPAALVVGACTNAISDPPDEAALGEEVQMDGEASAQTFAAPATIDDGADAEAGFAADEFAAEESAGRPHATATDDLIGVAPPGLHVIRDGRIDVRIEQGTFVETAAGVRTIAEDLGGYVSSGESHIQAVDEQDYTVGWFTIRIPVERFDEAMARVDELGERLDLEVSSQDVSEEYVDLEGRLGYWRNQEAFYARLMEEATTIDELVTIQTRMQDVLLNIEQIEGRLRYLDARTEYATLTVGITEVPGPLPVVEPSAPPGIVAGAIEQAGAVLLGTIGFLIVGAAFLIPVGIVAAAGYGMVRAVRSTRKVDERPPLPDREAGSPAVHLGELGLAVRAPRCEIGAVHQGPRRLGDLRHGTPLDAGHRRECVTVSLEAIVGDGCRGASGRSISTGG
jgi:hypothetical protein